mgnify:CR=1 FL=1
MRRVRTTGQLQVPKLVYVELRIMRHTHHKNGTPSTVSSGVGFCSGIETYVRGVVSPYAMRGQLFTHLFVYYSYSTNHTGSLIDCFNTIEYFRFRFWSQKHCLFFLRFFFAKESKIYCISDCLRKGRNFAKSDCLVSTKNMTCFENREQLSRVPTKND